MPYLYHYTDKKGADEIAKSGVLKPSLGPGDEAFGAGQYFTSKPPQTKTNDLLKNNWDGLQASAKKVEYVVEIPKTSLPKAEERGKPAQRDVWVNPTKQNLDLVKAGAKIYERK